MTEWSVHSVANYLFLGFLYELIIRLPKEVSIEASCVIVLGHEKIERFFESIRIAVTSVCVTMFLGG